MALELTVGLRGKWIKELAGRLSSIREEREAEVRDLSEVVAGADPFLLAERYIPSYVQIANPADLEDDTRHTGEELRSFAARISIFLERPGRKKDGRHVMFVLGDAGMGKTSALVMLRLTHLMSFWPQSVNFELLKVGEDTLAQIKEIKAPEKTVLLLDALDEDNSAFDDIKSRLL